MPDKSLSLFERLQLRNQFETLRLLTENNPKEEFNNEYYREMIEVLEEGYEFYYSDLYNAFDPKPVPSNITIFIFDVLDMYWAIESFKKKNPSDKDVDDHYLSTFRGFDGNHETEYLGMLRFILKKGKWKEVAQSASKTGNFNSHMELVGRYSAMVDIWKALPEKWDLTKEQVLEILKAGF